MSESISIVTPTLNAERYLAECLTSIRAQAYPGLEHIVVDGGSGDATESLARGSGARWLALPGSKQAAAINAGMRATSGAIVTWLNADDLYRRTTLQVVAETFAADPTADVICGDCDVIDERGQSLWREQPGAYDFDRLLRRGNFLAQPAVFFRRRVLDRVGFLDESLDYGMDYEFWLRLRDAKVVYVPRTLAAYRWHAQSKTARNNAANWRELIVIVRRHGGGWTPHLLWLFARARITLARQVLQRTLASPR